MKTVEIDNREYGVPDWVVSIAHDSGGNLIGYDAPVVPIGGVFDFYTMESHATQCWPVDVPTIDPVLSGRFKAVMYGNGVTFVAPAEAEYAALDSEGLLRWYSEKPLPGERAFWCVGLSGFINIDINDVDWRNSMNALSKQSWRGDRE